MNPILLEIEESGFTELPCGERVRVHSHVGPSSGRLIGRAVHAAAPRLACEVGLAFGASTLYILDALAETGEGRLIGMDPAQHDKTWRGGGLHNVRRAGFGHRYEFHEERSQFVLPRLAAAGTRIQFAFIDGWHTFDHTLVDFFFVDLMLDPGGIVVFDDVGYPSIRRLCHFLVTNRAYSVFAKDPMPRTPSRRVAVKRLAQRLLHPIVRDNFTPDHQATKAEDSIATAQLAAFRKEGDDSRRFDHFVAF